MTYPKIVILVPSVLLPYLHVYVNKQPHYIPQADK